MIWPLMDLGDSLNLVSKLILMSSSKTTVAFHRMGAWLAEVMRTVNMPMCGTLPDFGNFNMGEEWGGWYDIYEGVEELMPFAKAVSAKSHNFDENGDEAEKDYMRLMRIVLDAGYRGYVGHRI